VGACETTTQENTMTKNFADGDLIEATLGESIVRGRIAHMNVSAGIVGMTGTQTAALEQAGYKITVIEKAAPKVDIPTEGTWHDRLGQAWQFDATLPGEYPLIAGLDGPAARPEDNAPFTRLEPRAVTAKAVLDHIRAFAWADGFMSQLDATEKKFGVTND
jgi:hypothetical protein